MSDDVEATIHDYLRDFYDLSDEELDGGPRLRRFMDSMALMEFVAFLEEEFDIEIDQQDLTPVNFGTPSRVVAYVSAETEANDGA